MEYLDYAEEHHITSGKLIAYILDSLTLKIKDLLEFEKYEFKTDIDYDDKSTLTVFKQPNASSDDYVICKCGKDTIFTGIFKEYETDSKTNEYKCIILQKEQLFNRFVFIKNEEIISSTGIEDFIAQTITDNWISSGDIKLDKEYLNVVALTHTKIYAKVSTTVELTDGCFNLKTYLGNALEYYGIKLAFSVSSTALTIYILKDSATTYQININDSDVSGYTETYAVEALTKLLVRFDLKEDETIKSSTTLEYFLLTDRSITTDKTASDRADGSVRSMVIEAESEEEMYQSVQDKFSDNSYSHKISFNLYMDSLIYEYTKLYIGRNIKIKTKSGIRPTLITAVTISNESKFAEIELGKLKVTLIDKIRSLS